MRGPVRSFLIGFAVQLVGWFVMLVVRVEGDAILLVPVILGVIAALLARRPIGLMGAVFGVVAIYAVPIAAGMALSDEWQGPALLITLLTASGYAGGLALLWLRSARIAAARA